MQDNTTEPNSFSYEYYAVGFFDLLGQQDHLRRLQHLPNKNDAAAIAKTREDLKNSYGAVMGMRKMFADTFRTYIRKPLPTDSLTPEQRATYLQMDNNPIKFQGFSDSMLVYLSLCNTENAKLHTRGILGILTAAALTFIGCLGIGHPIRGGIDLGPGFEPAENEFYGPALSRAYTLESKIANYPRIIVGDELIQYLTLTHNQSQTGPLAAESKNIAKTCITCLAYDDDGIPFVDYLGPYFRDLLATTDGAKFINMAYNYVIQFSTRFKKEKNSQLAFRYTLLRNYFESRLPLWENLPPKVDN
jgi:hypothetical protein